MRSLLLLSAAFILSACANYSANTDVSDITLPDTRFRVIEDLTYTPPNWPQALRADIYQPLGDQLRPAVLMVHGGGWEGREPDDMRSIAETLASSGFVVVNVAYRFAPAYQFPAPLHDLQQAMHWIHANADRYNIDSQRVAALGYSAGAHLVSLLGLVAGTGGELDREYGGIITRPAAVIAGGTPSDLRKFTGGRLVPQFLGGTINEIPEVFAAASPVTHVHAKAPPFFIYHGSSDMLVGSDHASDFYAALQQAGVPSELYLLRLRGHMTAFVTAGGAIKTGMQFLQRVMPEQSATAASR